MKKKDISIKKIYRKYKKSNYFFFFHIVLGMFSAVILANSFFALAENAYNNSIGHKREEVAVLHDLKLGMRVSKKYLDDKLGVPKIERELDKFNSYVYSQDYYFVKILTPKDSETVVLFSIISDRHIPFKSPYLFQNNEIILGETKLNKISGLVKSFNLATTQLIFLITPPSRPNSFNTFIYSYSSFYGDEVVYPEQGWDTPIPEKATLGYLEPTDINSQDLDDSLTLNTITVTKLDLEEISIFDIGLSYLDHEAL
jgi:hypothetical protein